MFDFLDIKTKIIMCICIIILLFLFFGWIIDVFQIRKLKKALKKEKWIYEEGLKLEERQEQRRINNEYMDQINGSGM